MDKRLVEIDAEDTKTGEKPKSKFLLKSAADKSSDVSKDSSESSSTVKDVVVCPQTTEYPQHFVEENIDASCDFANIEYPGILKKHFTPPKSPLKGRDRDESSENEDSNKSPEKKLKVCGLKHKSLDYAKRIESISKAEEQNIKIPEAFTFTKINATPQKAAEIINKEKKTEKSVQAVSIIKLSTDKPNAVLCTYIRDARKRVDVPDDCHTSLNRALMPIDSHKAFEAKSCTVAKTEGRENFPAVCKVDVFESSPVAQSPLIDRSPLLNVELQIDENSVPLLLKRIDKLKQY